MIIPIRLSGLAVAPAHPLPPILASTGFNEVVILELQGSIDTEGDYSGESIGQLDLSIPVRDPYCHSPTATSIMHARRFDNLHIK